MRKVGNQEINLVDNSLNFVLCPSMQQVNSVNVPEPLFDFQTHTLTLSMDVCDLIWVLNHSVSLTSA